MADEPKKRSIGEMISTVSFYGVGVYFILDGSLLRDGAHRSGNMPVCGRLVQCALLAVPDS